MAIAITYRRCEVVCKKPEKLSHGWMSIAWYNEAKNWNTQ